jgi:hypothetical protein
LSFEYKPIGCGVCLHSKLFLSVDVGLRRNEMNAKHKLPFILLATVAGALDAQPYANASADGWVETEIAGASPSTPQSIVVSGDRVTWMAWDGDWDIWTWTPDGGAFRVTDNDYHESLGGVSGERIVFNQRKPDDDYEIFTWTPTDGSVQLTDNGVDDILSDFSGQRLVWNRFTQESTGQEVELLTRTIDDATEETILTTNSQTIAFVSGDRIVYIGNFNLVVWTPEKTFELNSGSDDRFESISGERIAWLGGLTDAYEVFTWAADDEVVTQITNYTDAIVDGKQPGPPKLSDDRVVWQQYDVGDSGLYETSEIVMWTPDGGLQQLTDDDRGDYSPKVSGDRVVWTLRDESVPAQPDYEVLMWAPGEGVVQLTDNAVTDYHPEVSGDHVVWVRYEEGVGSRLLTAVPADVAAVEQAEQIVADYADAIADGTLTGTGPGQSADGRAAALYNKLVLASGYIANGDYTAALSLLYDVYKFCDGLPKPGDFVTGVAREEIAGKTLALIELIETL